MIRNLVLMVVLFMMSSSTLFAQDTIRIMYYNLLRFPDESPERINFLRQIVGYAQPDILVVNELLSEEGADAILEDGLNVWGEDKYMAATYVDGPDMDNMLYYNSEKLGLKSQQQIPTGLRDISEYVLYYKSPGLAAESDTVYLNVYGMHLKAGSGFFNQRKDQALVLKYHLNSLDNTENVFAGGDFNFYSGNESGCLAIRETGDIELFDPISSIGDWSGNWSYASIHTQSTRTSPLGDGAGGGMDDRFDLIFVSEDALENTNGLEYINGTYKALGQDGDRFNESIHIPYNPTVPDSIADALYFMSDHLPVMMDVKTDYTAGINPANYESLQWYFNASAKQLVFNSALDGELQLFDLSGRLILSKELNQESTVDLPADLPPGILFWNLKGAVGKILVSN